ncbi:MAG: hypothetical protein J5648_01055 [Lachnospiraceae bacterium]|nr:hypothetical protein [Lachnospiraceae bacterium]
MKIDEAYAFIKNEKTNVSKPGLKRIHKLMRLLGNPEKRFRLIHVVGTNGKGSVTTMLSSILHEQGYRVGTMMSPALSGLKDYYRLDCAPVSDEQYIEAVEALKIVCGGISDEEYPSEFELSVALGVLLFANAGCDFVVLEAGMGGAWDATNLEKAGILTVITHIAIDHEKYLGSTLSEIANIKVNIAKNGETIVLAENEKEVRRVIKDYAFEHDCPYVYAPEGEYPLTKESTGAKLALTGLFQQANAKTVAAAVYALGLQGVYVGKDAFKKGLENAKLPFRFQIRRSNPYFIMDGGHNPDCMKALSECLAVFPQGTKFAAVTGVMADKDYCAMYPLIIPYVSKFYTVTPDNPRSLPAKDLAKYLKSVGAEAIPMKSLEDAAEAAAREYRNGSHVLCFGTLYMMHELEQKIRDTGLMI